MNGRHELIIIGTCALLLIAFVVRAGSLTPTAAPGATFYTLGTIYARLQTSGTVAEAAHSFNPISGNPGATLRTLAEIYNAIPTINPETVTSGTTYLTVAGTYNTANLTTANVRAGTAFGDSLTGAYPSAVNTLASASATADLGGNSSAITSSNAAVEWWQSDGTRQTATLDLPATTSVCANDTVNNTAGTIPTAAEIRAGTSICSVSGTMLLGLFSGSDTAGSFTGGSQANGGVDDANNGGAPGSGRFTGTWTACDSSNNYCSSGSSIADARDDTTNLIWSLPCNNTACTTFGETGQNSAVSWSASAPQGNVTAATLCSNQSGWRLPYQKELIQAYIDGAYGNLVPQGTITTEFWSSTTVSFNTGQAWGINLQIGTTGLAVKSAGRYLRCVR